MRGFLYIIACLLALQRWIDLVREGRDTIPVELQPERLRKAAELSAVAGFHRASHRSASVLPSLRGRCEEPA